MAKNTYEYADALNLINPEEDEYIDDTVLPSTSDFGL